MPAELSKLTLTAPFNDLEAVETIFRAHPGKIACVILEPVVGNAGFIPPDDGFLQALRRITEADGALLVFDEVMTGFRVAPGGAQERFGVVPDLTTLGKVIGGGLPVGAYGGRRDVMDWIAPVGPVYQAGTLSGNPLAMAAGLAQLRILRDEDPYPALERRTRAAGGGDAGRGGGGGRAHDGGQPGVHVGRVPCGGAGTQLRGREGRRTWRRSGASTTPPCGAGCSSRPRRSRPDSCPPPTRTRMSKKPSPAPARRFAMRWRSLAALALAAAGACAPRGARVPTVPVVVIRDTTVTNRPPAPRDTVVIAPTQPAQPAQPAPMAPVANATP